MKDVTPLVAYLSSWMTARRQFLELELKQAFDGRDPAWLAAHDLVTDLLAAQFGAPTDRRGTASTLSPEASLVEKELYRQARADLSMTLAHLTKARPKA